MEKLLTSFSKRTAVVLFFLLIAAVGLMLVGERVTSFRWVKKNIKSQIPQSNERQFKKTAASFPIELDARGIDQVLLHYFISATLANTIKTPAGLSIKLVEEIIPSFIIGPDTRISKIIPPYSEKNSIAAGPEILTSNVKVILSAEYDLRTTQWIVRDIFVPTDRNP